MYRSLELITGPTEAIVSAAEFKTFAKLPHDADISVISSATAWAEQFCNRRFLKQTWRMTFDYQPDVIDFPYGYLNSVDSVKTIAEDDSETTESSSYYSVQTGENGRLWLKSSYTWTTTTRDYQVMKIDFKVGHSTLSAMPELDKSNLQNAILNIASVLYFNRNIQVMLNERPDIKGILQSFWVPELS